MKSRECPVSSKGQITLPTGIRRKLNIVPGDSVVFIVTGDTIEIKKAVSKIECPACRGKKTINDITCPLCDATGNYTEKLKDGRVQISKLIKTMIEKFSKYKISILFTLVGELLFVIKLESKDNLEFVKELEYNINYYYIKTYIENSTIDTVEPMDMYIEILGVINPADKSELNNLILRLLKNKIVEDKAKPYKEYLKYYKLFNDVTIIDEIDSLLKGILK